MNKIWLSVKLFQRCVMNWQVVAYVVALDKYLVINFYYVFFCGSWLLSWLRIVTWSVHSGSCLLNILCATVLYQIRIETIWKARRKPLGQLAHIMFSLTGDMRLTPLWKWNCWLTIVKAERIVFTRKRYGSITIRNIHKGKKRKKS